MGCACSDAVVDSEERLQSNQSDTDDIWGDDEVLDSNADIKRSHEKQGYLDGIAAANESKLQEGFDVAFPEGAKLGIAVGQILAKVRSSGNNELFLQAKKELNITQVLNKKYFDDDLNRVGNHEVLEKWQGIATEL